jgi:hypothetical protein
MKWRPLLPSLCIAVLASSLPALSTDELLLRSGEKIVGTITGYENGMFRVETDFGVALVRKDKVASIRIGISTEKAAQGQEAKAPPTPSNSKAGHADATKAPSQAPAPGPASAPSPAIGAKGGTVPAPAPVPVLAPAPASKELSISSAPSAAKALPPPLPVSHPLDVPLPVPLAEHSEGTTYVNDTFQFSLYKPPGWKSYNGVARETGSGIMAMGTGDEQTLLIVDRQVWSGEPNLKDESAEARLRSAYQSYQKFSEEPTQCDGRAAIRTTFKGILDGVEWHGIAVHVANANTVFGIIGLTSADMFQFEQAVLNKIIRSFRFLPSTGATHAPPPSGPKR